MLIVMVTTATLAIAQAPPATAASIQATTKWAVAYDARMCTLTRSFGTPGGVTTLMLSPHIGSSRERIVLVVPARRNRRVERGKGTIVFAPSGTSAKFTYVIGPLPASPDQDGVDIILEQGSVRPSLATSNEIRIEVGDLKTTLRLTAVSAALKALTACQENLLIGWGVDPAVLIDNTSVGGISRFFGRDSYPRSALRRRVSGDLVVVANVDAAGKPTACRTVASSKDLDLDSGTCQIVMRKITFPPSTGQLMRYAVIGVTWVIF
jgi:TonB family protein